MKLYILTGFSNDTNVNARSFEMSTHWDYNKKILHKTFSSISLLLNTEKAQKGEYPVKYMIHVWKHAELIHKKHHSKYEVDTLRFRVNQFEPIDGQYGRRDGMFAVYKHPMGCFFISDTMTWGKLVIQMSPESRGRIYGNLQIYGNLWKFTNPPEAWGDI